MSDEFQYDVFLSHSSKDKAIVRDVAERLRRDGVKVWFDEWVLKPGDSIPAKIEEGLERSRVLVLCMSANAFGSEWAQLEAGTFRFRDPLNKERRFLPLRLDESHIRGTLAQFLYIDWLVGSRDQQYVKLLEACQINIEAGPSPEVSGAEVIRNEDSEAISAISVNPDGDLALIFGHDRILKLWDLRLFRCVRRFPNLKLSAIYIEWSNDGSKALVCSETGDAVLLDTQTGRLIADFRRNSLKEIQMKYFRMLAMGLSVAEIEYVFNRHQLTVWKGLRTLRDKLRIQTMEELRHAANAFYNGRKKQNPPLAKAAPELAAAVAWLIERDKIFDSKWKNDTILRPFSGLPNFWPHAAIEREFGGWRKTVKSPVFLKIKNALTLPQPQPWRVAWNADRSLVIQGLDDGTLHLWDARLSQKIHVFEGHTGCVQSLAWNTQSNLVISASSDETIRLWRIDSRSCIGTYSTAGRSILQVSWDTTGRYAFLADTRGRIQQWEVTEILVRELARSSGADGKYDQFQYTNAKVLLVGDTSAGKTGLTYRIATGKWKPSEDSTVGAWSTQWKIKDAHAEPGMDREIWLWDFGGQADQRLIHQLYMDRTALILLLFNADQEDVLPGIRDWQNALRRSVPSSIPCLLVAGRIDTGFRASKGKLQIFAKEQGINYFETSAKEGTGCNELRAAMIASIPWEKMERRTSPRVFKLIKDEILKMRDEGHVLHTFKELRELLWRRLPDEPRFTDEILQTVIGLLDGPGVVKELDYGSLILLAPEWINAYAQAVIRTLRSAENDLGVLPLRSIAEGKLIYQSIGRDGVPLEMKRLPPAEERVVLGEMERQLEQRGLCLRQGDKLVFPSHCGRDRPTKPEHPSVFVSYAVRGFLDDIYATLVVKLACSEAFQLKELWRDAVDFVTLVNDYQMGIKLTRQSGSEGEIIVYFGKGVTQEEQVIFANYIDAHLELSCEYARRLRHYVCPKCHVPKGNPEVLMKKLIREKENADTECDGCGQRFPLWDALERKFASAEVMKQVIEMQNVDAVRLDSRRKGKLLGLEVSARITSADQKCFEIPATEDEGLDMELEFTDDNGEGTGLRLYLQLKSGNSYLKKRKSDGAEIFTIKKQRWVKYWLQQPHPVMLVIGTFFEGDERASKMDKLEFAEVRWMEISSVIKRESANGTKAVKQIEFRGERLDLGSVRRWRDKIMALTPNR